MKLTKGKVTKLLNNKKQTMKKYKNKNKKSKKERKTFRNNKHKHLNLHNSSLKKLKKSKTIGGDKNVTFGDDEIIEFKGGEPVSSLEIPVTTQEEQSIAEPSPVEEQLVNENPTTIESTPTEEFSEPIEPLTTQPEPEVTSELEEVPLDALDIEPVQPIEEVSTSVVEEQPIVEEIPSVVEEQPIEELPTSVVEEQSPTLIEETPTEEEQPIVEEEKPAIVEETITKETSPTSVESAMKVLIENIEDNIANKVAQKISSGENILPPGQAVNDALRKFSGGKKNKTRKHKNIIRNKKSRKHTN